MYFQFFGLNLIPVPPNHMLLIANIDSFLNSNCPTTLNSNKSQKIANLQKLSILIIFQTQIVSNSKNIKIHSFWI